MILEVDGRRAYAYTGNRAVDPSRDTVLFVHGSGLDHTVWTLPARYFVRKGLNVLAVDLPGHGRSEGPPLDSMEAMADWIPRVLDAVGVERAALIGHSMGSLVVLEAAARHPERARALVLVGTGVPMPVAGPLLASAEANGHEAIDMLTVWGYSREGQLGGNETPGMWMVGGTMRLFERSGPGVLHTALVACNEYRHGLESAEKVECPTLFIVGDRDMLTPPLRAAEAAARIAGSRTVTLSGSGHSLMSERPDAVLDALVTMV